MLSENRQYHYIGEVLLKKSHVLDINIKPKDDVANWLFMEINEHKYGFIYKIIHPTEANYDFPFEIYLSFLMKEVVRDLIKLNNAYSLFRGEEKVGSIKIIKLLF